MIKMVKGFGKMSDQKEIRTIESESTISKVNEKSSTKYFKMTNI